MTCLTFLDPMSQPALIVLVCQSPSYSYVYTLLPLQSAKRMHDPFEQLETRSLMRSYLKSFKAFHTRLLIFYCLEYSSYTSILITATNGDKEKKIR
jgi:hypothetical protein